MKFKVKSIIAYMIIACMLMTFMPVFADGVTVENFEPVKLTVQFSGAGTGSANTKVVVTTADIPFTFTAGQLTGMYLNGTAKDGDTVVATFTDVLVNADSQRNDTTWNIQFANVDGLDRNSTITTYTWDLTLSRERLTTIENFEPFKLAVQFMGAGTGTAYSKVVVTTTSIPFDFTAGQLKGLYLNGTVNDGETLIATLTDVLVNTDSQRDNTTWNIEFENVDGLERATNTTYTWDLTLSREPLASEEPEPEEPPVDVTIENFEAFTLNVGAQGGPSSGVQRLVVYPDTFPFTVTAEDELVGLYINGTATGNDGSVVNFNDVQIISSEIRSNGAYNIDFAEIDGFKVDGTVTYTYDLTLSREPVTSVEPDEPDEPSVDVTIENFTAFTLNVGAKGVPSSGVQRLVVYSDNFPFTVTADNELVGLYINGTATDNSGNVVNFNDVVITASSLRTNPAYNIDFAALADFKAGDGSVTYTYDLTLSREPVTPVEPDEPDEPGEPTMVIYGMAGGNYKVEVQLDIRESNNQAFLEGYYTKTGDTLYATGNDNPLPANNTTDPAECNFSKEKVANITIGGTALTNVPIMGVRSGASGNLFCVVFSYYTINNLITAAGGTPFADTSSMYTAWMNDSATTIEIVDAPVKTGDAPAGSFFLQPSDFALNGDIVKSNYNGNDILFINMGDGTSYLDKPAEGSSATAIVKAPATGTYTVKAYMYIALTSDTNLSWPDGSRHAAIKIGSNDAVSVSGTTYDTAGWEWREVGTYTFTEGEEVLVQITDESCNFMRLAALSFSQDASYTPADSMLQENFEVFPADKVTLGNITAEVSSKSQQAVLFTLKNYSATAVDGATYVVAVYNGDDMVDVMFESAYAPAYGTQDDVTIIFETSSAWTTGKLMLWQSVGSMKSLMPALSF